MIIKLSIILALLVVLALGWHLKYLTATQTHTLESSDLQRKYRIHLPKTDDVNQILPLVIVLHGYGDFPWLIEYYSGFSKLSDKHQFIAVYPQGTRENQNGKFSWNAGSCCNPALENQVDDVKFIEDLIDSLLKTYPIDQNRIYLTGFSNGGMLTHRIASVIPQKITAAAVVAGSVGGTIDGNKYYTIAKPKKALPIMMIHGENDTTVPFLGGTNENNNATFTSFAESINFWVQNNMCNEEPDQTITSIYRHVIFDCNERVEAYTIYQREHNWFGSLPDKMLHPFRPSFPASETIWEFFDQAPQ